MSARASDSKTTVRLLRLSRLLRRAHRCLVTLERAAAGGLVLTVFAVVLSQVLMRYVFSRPNPWSEEVSRFCLVWLSMIGAALAAEYKSHFRFDQTLSLFPRYWRARFRLYASWAVAAVSVVLVVAGVALVEVTITERSPVLNFPMAWMYGAVPTSGMLMLLHLLAADHSEDDGG